MTNSRWKMACNAIWTPYKSELTIGEKNRVKDDSPLGMHRDQKSKAEDDGIKLY